MRNGLVRELKQEEVVEHPSHDVSVLELRDPLPNIEGCPLAAEPAGTGDSVVCLGHVSAMPTVEARWHGKKLAISGWCAVSSVRDCNGRIKRLFTLNVNANDIKLHGVQGFEIDVQSVVGMSGGPVVHHGTREVVGMLSIGLPPDAPVRKQTFAVAAAEILPLLDH